jgi:hypothetical protein
MLSVSFIIFISMRFPQKTRWMQPASNYLKLKKMEKGTPVEMVPRSIHPDGDVRGKLVYGYPHIASGALRVSGHPTLAPAR